MVDFNVLNGIQNFLQMVNDNWTTIIIIICLANALWIKIKNYLVMSDEDKINAVKACIKETILEKVTNAEIEYEDWISAGAIKRSQVINEIFEMYPILYKVTDQESLIAWMDKTIDEALKIMRDILEKNTDNQD